MAKYMLRTKKYFNNNYYIYFLIENIFMIYNILLCEI